VLEGGFGVWWGCGWWLCEGTRLVAGDRMERWRREDVLCVAEVGAALLRMGAGRWNGDRENQKLLSIRSNRTGGRNTVNRQTAYDARKEQYPQLYGEVFLSTYTIHYDKPSLDVSHETAKKLTPKTALPLHVQQPPSS